MPSNLDRKSFLAAVVQTLVSQDIPFCISRNHHEFWHDGPSDVDLIVPPRCICDASRAIRDAAGQTGYHLVARMLFDNVCLVFHAVNGGFVRIDLDTAVRWRSRTLLTSEKVLGKLGERDGLPAPAPEHEALVLLCQCAWSGKLKESYRKRLMELANPEDDADPTCVFLNQSFGFNPEALLRLIDGGGVGELRQCLRHGTAPQARLRNLLSLIGRSLQRAARPPGIVIECPGLPENSRKQTERQMELLFPSSKAVRDEDPPIRIAGSLFRGGVLWDGCGKNQICVRLLRIWCGHRRCFRWTPEGIRHPASGQSAQAHNTADFIGRVLADGFISTD
jgi:hypothetical protein